MGRSRSILSAFQDCGGNLDVPGLSRTYKGVECLLHALRVSSIPRSAGGVNRKYRLCSGVRFYARPGAQVGNYTFFAQVALCDRCDTD